VPRRRWALAVSASSARGLTAVALSPSPALPWVKLAAISAAQVRKFVFEYLASIRNFSMPSKDYSNKDRPEACDIFSENSLIIHADVDGKRRYK
jgi:hypothetical protein